MKLQSLQTICCVEHAMPSGGQLAADHLGQVKGVFDQ